MWRQRANLYTIIRMKMARNEDDMEKSEIQRMNYWMQQNPFPTETQWRSPSMTALNKTSIMAVSHDDICWKEPNSDSISEFGVLFDDTLPHFEPPLILDANALEDIKAMDHGVATMSI